MGILDWIVLGIFCCALAGIIIWVVKQKDKTSEDYFLAGRDATWIAIGASIFASNIGSEHLVGLAGAGASSGMAMAHWEMHGWLILILGWFFVPFYARSGVFTMPEFLEKRYNRNSRSFLSIISLVSYVLTKVAVTVYAGGVVFKEVFGIESIFGIDFFWISAVGLVLLTGIYTTLGGMKAVLWTSVLQTPVLLIGSLAVLVMGLIKLGGMVGNDGNLQSRSGKCCRRQYDRSHKVCQRSRISMDRCPAWFRYYWILVLVHRSVYCAEGIIRTRSEAIKKGCDPGSIFQTDPGVYFPDSRDDSICPE